MNSQVPFGLTVPDEQKWSKKPIIVCWAKKSDESKICRPSSSSPKIEEEPLESSQYKKIIQETIIKEYTKEKTGIHFIGWNNCADGGKYDVMLFVSSFNQSPAIEGAIGESCIGPCSISYGNSQGVPYVILGANPGSTLNLIDKQDDLHMTVLHEFGHLSGLYHEHLNYPEIVKSKADKKERMVSTSLLDEHSIMNYELLLKVQKMGSNFLQKKANRVFTNQSNVVNIKSINENEEEVSVRIGLSSGDLNALKCLYVYSDEEKIKLCHDKARP